MGDEIDDLADAVEHWKQARFHLGRLMTALEEVDPDGFRDEFVDDGFEADLFDLLVEAAE